MNERCENAVLLFVHRTLNLLLDKIISIVANIGILRLKESKQ